MKELKKSLFYAIAIGSIISSSIHRAYAYPSLFYSSSSVRRVNKELCIMESYSVLAKEQFYPVRNAQRNNNAVFAMARDSDTQILVLCGQVSNHGTIIVIAASDRAIGMSLTEKILGQIIERLKSY